MKLLLVDGNVKELRALKKAVRWSELDINFVSTAYQGQNARELIETKQIDMMICMTELPDMTGIQLLQWIREHDYPIEIILVTEKIEYQTVRQALQFGAFDYLLKPMEITELEHVLQTLTEKIRQDRQEAEKRLYSDYWIENQAMVQELFWKNVCLKRIANQPEEIEKKAKSVNISLEKDSSYQLVLITIKNPEELSDMGEDQCREGIQKLAQELIKIDSDFSQIIVIYTRVVIILNEAEFASFYERCERLVWKCREMLGAELLCYISEPVYCEELSTAYGILLEYSKDDVLSQDHMIEVVHQKKSGSKQRIILPLQWNEYLYEGQVDLLISGIRFFLTDLAKSGNLNEMNFRIFQQDMLQLFFTYMEKKELKAHELYENNEIYKSYKTAIFSVDDMCSWSRKCMDFILKRTNHEILTGNEKMVGRVKLLINADLKTEISRAQMGNLLSMNPDYINRVFKRETGRTIKEYTIYKRIQEAKSLLKTSELTVSEVAVSIGCDNFSYFTKVFKKQTGMTPKQYKKSKIEK